MTCAGLLVAAPLALFLSGGGDGDGSSGVPDRVFTGGPATGTEEGTGRGGAGVATESSRSPEVGLPPMDGTANLVPGGAPAGAGVAGGGSNGVAGAGGGGAGGGTGRGTAAGTPAGPAAGGLAGGSGPGTAPPGGTTPEEGNGPPPAEEDEDCGCPPHPLEPVTDVVDDLTNTVGGTAGGLLGQ